MVAQPPLADLPCDAEGPVFGAPWQARAFALTVALHERGLFSWEEWARSLSGTIKSAQAAGDPDTGETYYLHWLAALEALLVEKGVTGVGMLTITREAWDAQARATPHGQPIELSPPGTVRLDKISRQINYGGDAMARWVAFFKDTREMLKIREERGALHLAYLEKHKDQILVGGGLRPEPGADFVGGLWVLEVESREEAVALVENDPYYVLPFRSYQLFTWGKAIDRPVTL